MLIFNDFRDKDVVGLSLTEEVGNEATLETLALHAFRDSVLFCGILRSLIPVSFLSYLFGDR
ncbi:hypothetical protein C7271_15480 [filamentous cyanobacterium CCP5]|nr:hypothetical protein C7271_15480 [filamentous cyanobacterium CCP5]